MNTRIVHSQYMGGMIWGISSALHEATEIDARYARYVNDNLADYMIPVNADVKDVQVILVSEEDHDEHPAGVKGLGELANVGTAAAIANAVYHAIGKRIRQLPIRIESCLQAGRTELSLAVNLCDRPPGAWRRDICAGWRQCRRAAPEV